jgi:hypothetical protein
VLAGEMRLDGGKGRFLCRSDDETGVANAIVTPDLFSEKSTPAGIG